MNKMNKKKNKNKMKNLNKEIIHQVKTTIIIHRTRIESHSIYTYSVIKKAFIMHLNVIAFYFLLYKAFPMIKIA